MKLRDLTNQRFHEYTVIRFAGGRKSLWECRCSCGNIQLVQSYNLVSGNSKSCGQCGFKDYTGMKSGYLTVLGRGPKVGGRINWLCKCDGCGKTRVLPGARLARKDKSCGCKRYEMAAAAMTTHGFCARGKMHPMHHVWSSMKERCFNSRCRGFANYGGRGITVCRRWRDSFGDWFGDVGERPEPKWSLDRIDMNGNYSCGQCDECITNDWQPNVRWASPSEQARNKRNVKRLTFRGRTQLLLEWADEMGLPPRVIALRLKLGKSVEDALLTPVRQLTGKTPEQHCLNSIRRNFIKRCHNPNDIAYHNYGGRGITVCARWLESVKHFKEDMGERPEPGLSLDRINNDGGYWCGKPECADCGPLGRKPNCRWATRDVQMANRRCTKRLSQGHSRS